MRARYIESLRRCFAFALIAAATLPLPSPLRRCRRERGATYDARRWQQAMPSAMAGARQREEALMMPRCRHADREQRRTARHARAIYGAMRRVYDDSARRRAPPVLRVAAGYAFARFICYGDARAL